MPQFRTPGEATAARVARWTCVLASSAVATSAYAQEPSTPAQSAPGAESRPPSNASPASDPRHSPAGPAEPTPPSADAGTATPPSESIRASDSGSPQSPQGKPVQSTNQQDSATVHSATSDEDSTLSTVIVTGVRGGPPRTVATSPAPIDVVSGEALVKTGRAELGEAIAKLLPSINFGTNSAGIGSIVRPVMNRGLGPAYTLVLINGKRRHSGTQITGAAGAPAESTPSTWI